MSRFALIVKGTRARKTVTLPLLEAEAASVDVRVVLGEDEAEAIARAHAFCKSKDRPDAAAGDELFELGRMSELLALACVDPESSADAPAPFFESGAEIRKHLDRDRIAYLFELQQDWQIECSPSPASLGAEDFAQKLVEVATSEDDRPFARWPRAMLVSFVRSTARLLLSFQELKSSSGQGSTDSSPSTSA